MKQAQTFAPKCNAMSSEQKVLSLFQEVVGNLVRFVLNT
jgi:hypothetical protein